MSESGNSSKFDVSSMLLISIGMAAGRSLLVEVGTSRINTRPWDELHTIDTQGSGAQQLMTTKG